MTVVSTTWRCNLSGTRDRSSPTVSLLRRDEKERERGIRIKRWSVLLRAEGDLVFESQSNTNAFENALLLERANESKTTATYTRNSKTYRDGQPIRAFLLTVRLKLDRRFVQRISTNRARIERGAPRPHRDGVPFFHLDFSFSGGSSITRGSRSCRSERRLSSFVRVHGIVDHLSLCKGVLVLI